MTNYIRHGARYQVTPNGALDIAELLPLGTYKVGYVEMADEYFLEKIEDFAEPVGKVYGDTLKHRDRILRTFDDRPSATGVMLSGEKGSGKTLLAKLLSLEGQEKGIPTIVINQPWRGDTFNAFMQSIEQPAIVVFDEYEKVYDNEAQEKLLTLFDGVYASKKLFIITTNHRFKVNQHMLNRPGRIFYRLDYKGLSAEFVREYCKDLLADQARVEEVVRVSMLFSRFSFDILKALVEEMNRFDEAAEDAMRMLNAKPEFGEKLRYVVTLKVNGKLVPDKQMHNKGEWRGNPLTDEVEVYFQGTRKRTPVEEQAAPWDLQLDEGGSEDDSQMIPARFRPSDLKKVNVEDGSFTFEAGGFEASMREKTYSSYDMSVLY